MTTSLPTWFFLSFFGHVSSAVDDGSGVDGHVILCSMLTCLPAPVSSFHAHLSSSNHQTEISIGLRFHLPCA